MCCKSEVYNVITLVITVMGLKQDTETLTCGIQFTLRFTLDNLKL